MQLKIEATGVLIVSGIIFWLAGGAGWVSEKTRTLKIENDALEAHHAPCQCPEQESKPDVP